jgi:hypothetical protein
VYVDSLIRTVRSRRWPFWSSCHLFADSPEELHPFARGLGLRRDWFQDDPRLPHYDLNPRRREAAVQRGAIEVDRHFVAATMKLRRRAREEGLAGFVDEMTERITRTLELPRELLEQRK